MRAAHRANAWLILAGILASTALAGAQTDLTWTNDDGTGLWNTTDANWISGGLAQPWDEPEITIDGIFPGDTGITTDPPSGDDEAFDYILDNPMDTAVFGDDPATHVIVSEPVNVAGIRFEGSEAYTIDIRTSPRLYRSAEPRPVESLDGVPYVDESGLNLYGQVTVADGTPAPEFIVSGTMMAAGANGTFHGIEDLITLRHRTDTRFVRLRLDNSNEVAGETSPVNEDRWGDNAPVVLDTDVSIFDLTAGPGAHEDNGQDITEQVGTLRFGGVALTRVYVDVFDEAPEQGSGFTATIYRHDPDYRTTLSLAGLEREGQGVLMLASKDVFESSLWPINTTRLGTSNRIIVRDPTFAQTLIEGDPVDNPTEGDDYQHTMVAPYIVDHQLRSFLTYNASSDGDGEIGFETTDIDVFVPELDIDQSQRIVLARDGGAYVNDEFISGFRVRIPNDVKVMAIKTRDDLDPLHWGGQVGRSTLTITSGGFISESATRVNCNIVAGENEADTTELIVTAFSNTGFHGTITAAGMTIASLRRSTKADAADINSRQVVIHGDNVGLEGPISIFQEAGDVTNFGHVNAPGIGNDLTIGAGRVYLSAPGETFAFGEIDIWSGRMDIAQASLTTTTSPEEVRDMILAGKIMSSNAGPIGEDGPELVMAYKEIVDEGNLLVGLAIPGDANMDGEVNLADLSLLARNWNSQEGHWFTGDFNLDTLVNLSDLSLLARNWGQETTAEELAPMLDVVPEPASMSLLAIGGLTFFRFRRRR